MPIFGSRREPSPIREPEPVPSRKPTLFKRNEPAPAPVAAPVTKSHGLRHHRTSQSVSSRSSAESHASSMSSGSHHKRGSLLSRFGGRDNDVDPSVISARERIMDAEAAETSADRALEEARLRVREAKLQATRVETEAAEEARRAKVKQHHARDVTKRGKVLGRHGV